MPSLTASYRNYRCPEAFQERLTRAGGINRFGEPNFILRWAQGGEKECFYRAGGTWNVEGLPSFTGYRNLLVGGGTPSWMLMQWNAPEVYGTPEMWYVQGYDQASNLQTLGSYPYKGRYEMLYNLRTTRKEGRNIKFQAMPLNSLLINTIIPIIKQARDISWEKTKAVLQDIEIREQAKDLTMIEDVMRANALPFKGSPVSYGKQGCRTSQVDKKIEQMTRNWNKIQTSAKALDKGFYQR